MISDRELIEVATELRNGILAGRSSEFMCAAVCWPLQSYLSAFHALETEAVEADLGVCNHIWLLLPDGRALDPTGDQFNWCNTEKMPPVYLGPPIKIHTRGLSELANAPDEGRDDA